MRSSVAIFIKQYQDILKNMSVLVQFIVFPLMAFVMTWLLDVKIEGLSDSFFISIFASMFIGMTLISVSAVAIAEDRENKSLQFLMIAGVKSHQYLIGIGGVFLVFTLIVSSIFVIMMPELYLIERFIMLLSLMLGAVSSILLGGIIGIFSKNEQSAVSIGTAFGMFMGFGPMLSVFNENVDKIFSIFYTKNFIYHDFYSGHITSSITVILVNIAMLAVVFAWVYIKQKAI